MLSVSTRPSPVATWGGELRACLALAGPLVLTNAIEMSMNLISTVVIGHIGPDALAASTLALALYNAALLFGLGLTAAVSPLIARGMVERTMVRRAAQGGFWNAVLVTGPIWALLWEAEPIFKALGQDPALSRAAADYLHVVQWSFFPAMLYLVLRSVLAAVEQPGWAVVIGAAAVALDAILNTVLINGFGLIPGLGLAGSGLAMVLANIFMAAALLLVVTTHRRFSDYRILRGLFRPDPTIAVALWRMGLPIGIAILLETGMFAAAAGLIGHFDEGALAAHAIALQIASFAFVIPLGIAQAATVRVGRAAGANDHLAVGRAGWTALLLGVGTMVGTSLLLVSLPRLIVGLFLDPGAPGAEATMLGAVTLLTLAGLFQVADGAQVVTAGMLRGLGDTRATMIIAAVGYWGLGVPLAVALAPGSGAKGVWMGLVAGLFATAAMLLARWHAWRRSASTTRAY
jgi:multidrug resistance protein, MATE family